MMKKILVLLFCFLFVLSSMSFAQRRGKRGGQKGEFQPTAAQLMNFKESYKKMLGDSLNIPMAKRDTVASLALSYLLRQMKIDNDKTIAKEDKDVQKGMLDDDKYMHMGAILSGDELSRLISFDKKQKQLQQEREKAQKEQYNNEMNNSNNNRGYGGYGGGYGGYGGGYGGYGR